MATVTSFTSARMLEIENSAIVSGTINPVGNLILTRKDGAQIDAGTSIPVVPLASDIEPGRVELATALETQTGTNATLAVTPASLAAYEASMVGKRLQAVLLYTASTTFTKATYPNLKAVRVRTVGGGGGGGGANAATAGNHSCGGGGGGGGYAEALIPAASLAASETITIGAGGSGGAVGAVGGTGGSTSFGTLVVATGGVGGNILSNNAAYISAAGGKGGVGTTGDIKTPGSPGHYGAGYATIATGGIGGSSMYGAGGEGFVSTAAIGVAGLPGSGYGGGGAGALVNQNAAGATGGAATSGVVIVEVYV